MFRILCILALLVTGSQSLAKTKSLKDKIVFREPQKNEEIVFLGNPQVGKKAINSKSIKLLVWNVLTGHKRKWEEIFKQFTNNKDLVLIQESFLDAKMTRVLGKETPFFWTMATAYIYTKENVPSGVATGSHMKPLSSRNIHSKFKEPLMGVKKSTLFTTYPLSNGSVLMVVNVHAINFVADQVFFEQMANVLIAAKKHHGPLIMAGDFNTFNYGKIKFLDQVAKKLKMTEVEYGDDIRKKFMKYPLDHIYYRGIKPKSVKVLNSRLGSDHNAIEAEFEI